VISIYYYFGWIKAAFFATARPSAGDVAPESRRTYTPVSAGFRIVFTLLALSSVLLGFFQGSLSNWIFVR
jgi:NADH-quinone oxidoreductase subunit N